MNYIKSEILFLNPTSHISSVQQPYMANGYHNQTGLRGLLSKLLHTKSFLFISSEGMRAAHREKA